jgi:hypothetical protein
MHVGFNQIACQLKIKDIVSAVFKSGQRIAFLCHNLIKEAASSHFCLRQPLLTIEDSL